MNTPQRVSLPVGVADGTIESVTISGDEVRVVVECWNAKIMHITFEGVVATSWKESADLDEIFVREPSSDFAISALRRSFENTTAHELVREFFITDCDGDEVLTVVGRAVSATVEPETK